MSVIVTVAPTEPMAGGTFELSGSVAQRSSDLVAFAQAIAIEVGLDPAFVVVSGTDVLVEGQVRYTLSDGWLDRPLNASLSRVVRHYLQEHQGDRDTVVLQVLRACIRYGKRKRGMSRAAVLNVVGNIYDAIASDDD